MRVLYHQKNPRLVKNENEDLQPVKSTKNSSPKVIKIFRNEPGGTFQGFNNQISVSPGFGPATFDDPSPSPSPLLGLEGKNNYKRDSGPASSNAEALN